MNGRRRPWRGLWWNPQADIDNTKRWYCLDLAVTVPARSLSEPLLCYIPAFMFLMIKSMSYVEILDLSKGCDYGFD